MEDYDLEESNYFYNDFENKYPKLNKLLFEKGKDNIINGVISYFKINLNNKSARFFGVEHIKNNDSTFHKNCPVLYTDILDYLDKKIIETDKYLDIFVETDYNRGEDEVHFKHLFNSNSNDDTIKRVNTKYLSCFYGNKKDPNSRCLARFHHIDTRFIRVNQINYNFLAQFKNYFFMKNISSFDREDLKKYWSSQLKIKNKQKIIDDRVQTLIIMDEILDKINTEENLELDLTGNSFIDFIYFPYLRLVKGNYKNFKQFEGLRKIGSQNVASNIIEFIRAERQASISKITELFENLLEKEFPNVNNFFESDVKFENYPELVNDINEFYATLMDSYFLGRFCRYCFDDNLENKSTIVLTGSGHTERYEKFFVDKIEFQTGVRYSRNVLLNCVEI